MLGVRGEIVRGPNDSGWTNSRPRWTLTSDWIGAPLTAVEPDHARTELVRTWLRTFGPATVTDIKWWFGNTLTWARQALRDIGAVEVDLHGSPGYALADDLDTEPEPEPWAALLPGLDVTTMAGSTATGISEHTAARSSTATAMPDSPRGGTAASWVAGGRTTTVGFGCTSSRRSAATAPGLCRSAPTR